MPVKYGNLTPEKLAMHNIKKPIGVVRKAGGIFRKAATSAKSKITDTAENIKDTVSHARNTAVKAVAQAKQTVDNVGASVRATGAQAVNQITKTVSEQFDKAKSQITDTAKAVKEDVTDFAGDAKDFASDLAHTVGDAAETGFDYVKETATDVSNDVDDAYDFVRDSANSAVDNVRDSALELGNSIASAADSDGDGKKEVSLALPECIEDSKVVGWLGEIAERSINNNPFFQLVGYEIDIETSIPPETVDLVEEIALDVAQVGLGVLGFIPGFGEAADLASAAISLKQEDYVGAALDAASAIPFAGWATGAASIIKHGDDIADAFKAIKKISNTVDAVDTAVDTARAVENAGDIAKGVDNAVDAAKAIDNAADASKALDNASDASRALGDGIEEISEEAGKNLPYSTSRPPYAKGQVEEVWEAAKDADGRVFDPNTGEELFWDPTEPRSGQWDMGHIQGKKYSDLHDDYIKGNITKQEFLDKYRDPSNYRPESPSSNRSHKYE